MSLFYFNWPVLMILPLEEWPVSQTCEFKQIRDCFYDRDKCY